MADGSSPDRTGPPPPTPDAAPYDPATGGASYHWPFGEAVTTSEVSSPGRGPGRGLGGVLALAALTSLLVGGGAGFGAARLADRSAPAASSVPNDPADPGSPAPAPLPSSGTTSTVEVARRALPSTVMIEVRSSDGQGTGSGFVLDRQGHILTNNHVVADAADGARVRVVFSDGRRVNASLVGRSPSYDLAVIKVSADDRLRPVTFGDSDAAVVGSPVVAVGSPLGLPGTVTQGIVSALDRPVTVSASRSADSPTAYIDGIQTDAPINPGNSGGPLFDAGARVIGVNSAILTLGGQGRAGNIGIGFAIPINQARAIGDLLVEDGRATYPVIGVQLRESGSGVELSGVDAGSPARKAGLRTGDRVTAVDDRRVSTQEELVVAVRTYRPGAVVTFAYTRGADRREARVTLGGKVG